MNKIEQLLQKYCPDGVEFKSLWEFCEFKKWQNLVKNDIISGDIPVIAGWREPISFHNEFNRNTEVVTVSSSWAYSGFISFWDQPIFLTDAFSIIPNELLLTKYIFYFLKSKQDKIYKMQKGWGVPHVYSKDVAKIQIPIPPIEIQKEIVKILDTFTELEAELEARKKQYEYYKGNLMLNAGWKIEKLDNITDIFLGLTYTPKYVDQGIKFISAKDTSSDFLDLKNTKFISVEEYNSSTSNAKPKKGDILFTRVGSNLGHPVIVDTDEDLCIFVSLGYLRVNKEMILNSYLKYWMNTTLFWDQVKKNVHWAWKFNLNTWWLKKFELMLPSLEKQQEIVAILDKFDALVNDISVGLPAEIKARKQQYEYYRGKLLTFKKLKK